MREHWLALRTPRGNERNCTNKHPTKRRATADEILVTMWHNITEKNTWSIADNRHPKKYLHHDTRSMLNKIMHVILNIDAKGSKQDWRAKQAEDIFPALQQFSPQFPTSHQTLSHGIIVSFPHVIWETPNGIREIGPEGWKYGWTKSVSFNLRMD